MHLTTHTTKGSRNLKVLKSVTHQQKIYIKSSNLIFLCFDESTDIAGSVSFTIVIHYCLGKNIEEQFISLTSPISPFNIISNKKTGILNAIVNDLAERKIDHFKIVSVITDGAAACNMNVEENCFASLFAKHIEHKFLCIRQQVSYGKASFKLVDDIMNILTKLNNFLSAYILTK